MKVDIDKRPSSNNDPHPFFCLRLYPESNEEMGNMEWGLSVMGDLDNVVKVCNGSGEKTFHYAITFKRR